MPNHSLQQSYRHCARVTRRAGSSFYWSFWLLPRDKRNAMCALYAFSRRADDIADGDLPESSGGIEGRRQELNNWRESFQQAIEGQSNDPILLALADTIERYEIPKQYLLDILDGVEMDLTECRFETFEDLNRYSYRVASAVGLACIHIWGFDGKDAIEPAIKCGQAFQLTNILRDLKEDAQRDRVYLPLADLRKFDYTPEELKRGVCDERFAALMRFEIDRAEQLFREAAPLQKHLQRDGRRILGTMTVTYRQLLCKIKQCNGDVFSRRVRLGWGRKMLIAAAHFLTSSKS